MTERTDGDDHFLTYIGAEVGDDLLIVLGCQCADAADEVGHRLGFGQINHLDTEVCGSVVGCVVRTALQGHQAVVGRDELAAVNEGVEHLHVHGIVALVVARVADAQGRTLVLLLVVAHELKGAHIVAGPVPVRIVLGVAAAAVLIIIPLGSVHQRGLGEAAEHECAAHGDLQLGHAIHEVVCLHLLGHFGVSFLLYGDGVVLQREVAELEVTLCVGLGGLEVAYLDGGAC